MHLHGWRVSWHDPCLYCRATIHFGRAPPGTQERPMKSVVLACLPLSLLPAVSAPLVAHASAHRVLRVQSIPSTFRLRVAHPAPSASFWVAYGPLNGEFGIKRL